MDLIREWHIVICGFLQRAGDLNGMVTVWGDLIRLKSQNPQARVELRFWDCNVADLAELISRLRPDGAAPIVNVYGYSWGGMTAANFARELRRRGVDVNHMVLSDAVYRHWYRCGWWRAFVQWWSIRIPQNVKRVTHFKQRESLPMGHKIVAENPGLTDMDPVQILKVDHCWMDDAPRFHQACLSAARGVKLS